MPQIPSLSVALIIAGFLAAALISELSLRGVDASIQGRLLSSLAPLRIVHIFGIPAILGLAFLFPAYSWCLFVAYFALAASLAVFKLWRLQLPLRLRNLQVASVCAVFLGVLFAAGASVAV